MGMAIGGSKGGPVSDPNIVPLIDVLLVLIIIFMVITPTVPTGLPALVPQPSSPQPKPETPNAHTIVVQVMQGEKTQDQSGAHRLERARPAPFRYFQGARRQGGLRKGRRRNSVCTSGAGD